EQPSTSQYQSVPSFDSTSPTRESGYGTTSTSVEKDLAGYEQPIILSYEEEQQKVRELEEIREKEKWLDEERKRVEREREEEEEMERRRREMEQVEEEQRKELERLRWEEETRKDDDLRELYSFLFSSDDILIDSIEVRDGAESRTDGHSTDDEAFAFSETAPRFQLPEGVEDWQQGREAEWSTDNKPRMWTTVFEGDESEQPGVETDEVFPLPPSGSVATQSGTQTAGAPIVYRTRYGSTTHEENSPVDAIEMDEVYDNFSIADASTSKSIPSTVSGGFRFDRGQEIAFDSAPKSSSQLSQHRPSIPEISVTIHETLESDEEESGEENTSDDEDYPDKVISAPVDPPVSYEEVEREREANEAAATHMLQQIQAFGIEEANDEFDVQWAHSQLKKTKKVRSSAASAAKTEEGSAAIARTNPFLDDDEVNVDMEELKDYSDAAAYYAGMGSGGLINHRPGPVYTITEEDEGERVVDGDAKTVAREKARRTAAAATNAIMNFYEQQQEEQRKKSSGSEGTVGIPRTTSSTTSMTRTETKTTTASVSSDSVSTSTPSISKSDKNYTQFDLPSYSSLPSTSSSSIVTIPPASFTASMEAATKARIIDPSLQISAVAEPTDVIDHSDRLFEAVYRNESANSKPNLLFYDDSSFISLANDALGTSTSPSFLIPNTGEISSDDSPSTPSKLKRSPAMMMPSEPRKIIDPIDPTMTSSTTAATTADFTRFPLPPKEKTVETTTKPGDSAGSII
ncbi:hypothetical protein PFISCL1PPCAC_15326, partial [Pristionchus fissidentatus]